MCKENRTFEDYIFSDATYYKWIREWIRFGLIEEEGEGKKALLSLTKDGEWVAGSDSEDQFIERLNRFLK